MSMFKDFAQLSQFQLLLDLPHAVLLVQVGVAGRLVHPGRRLALAAVLDDAQLAWGHIPFDSGQCPMRDSVPEYAREHRERRDKCYQRCESKHLGACGKSDKSVEVNRGHVDGRSIYTLSM